MTEYSVAITWYDEISTLVVDAASAEDAIRQAKDAMEKLVRQKAFECGYDAALTESEVRAYRDAYTYHAADAWAHRWQPEADHAAMLERWRTPYLPTACRPSW